MIDVRSHRSVVVDGGEDGQLSTSARPACVKATRRVNRSLAVRLCLCSCSCAASAASLIRNKG
eukprot:3243704-Pleurochrysis_carterae.AAC.1